MADMPNPDLLSTTQAAEVIGIERSTVSRWVQQGLMRPSLKLPTQTGAFLFDVAEVERVRDWYAARLAEPKAATS